MSGLTERGHSVQIVPMGAGSNRFKVINAIGGGLLGEVSENAGGTWTARKRGMPDLVAGGWSSRDEAAEFLASSAPVARRRRA